MKTGKRFTVKTRDADNFFPVRLFREMGYLQELNRTFLHPLGLALATLIHDNGDESIQGVLVTPDKSGFIYDEGYINSGEAVAKAQFIAERRAFMAEKRINKLGFVVQPINPEALGGPSADTDATVETLVSICQTLPKEELKALFTKLANDDDIKKIMKEALHESQA